MAYPHKVSILYQVPVLKTTKATIINFRISVSRAHFEPSNKLVKEKMETNRKKPYTNMELAEKDPKLLNKYNIINR